jgi:hypothetical protein
MDQEILKRIAGDSNRSQAERDAARRQLAGGAASPARGYHPEPAGAERLPASLAPEPAELDREMSLMFGKKRDWDLQDMSTYAQQLWQDLLSLGLLGPSHGFEVTTETFARVRSLYETTGSDRLREQALCAIRTLAAGSNPCLFIPDAVAADSRRYLGSLGFSDY